MCKQKGPILESKDSHSLLISILEVVTAVVVTLALIFNSIKTRKMGKSYDELNLTADDYTLFIDINARHRYEFEETYAKQLNLNNPDNTKLSRGILFKDYI